jgi:hypothetical protein
MADENGEFRVNTPSLATPGTGTGFQPVIVDDIIPPRYPETGTEVGCTISIYRPGELVPIEGLARIEIPFGAILCYIMPHEAVNMRPAIQALRRMIEERIRQERQRLGEMGR